MHFEGARRDEFLRFLDMLVAEHPGKELHLVLDNLSVHKLKEDHLWRVKHPNVHFHFTPTHASWIHQVEAWFSILSRAALKYASFKNTKELIDAIEKFIHTYNESAEPFQWTKVRVTQNALFVSVFRCDEPAFQLIAEIRTERTETEIIFSMLSSIAIGAAFGINL